MIQKTLLSSPKLQLVLLVLFIHYKSSLTEYEEAPSIKYLKSKTFGNMILVPNKKLKANNVDITIPQSSMCKCRTACFAHTKCCAFSLVTLTDDVKECQLTYKRPYDTVLEDSSNSVHVVMQASIPIRLEGFMEDNHLYISPSRRRTFWGAARFCKNIPGFQLAIFKTPVEYQTLIKLSQSVGYGLYIYLWNPNHIRKWGDGSTLEITSENTAEGSNGVIGIDGDLENDKYVYYLRNKNLKFTDNYRNVTRFFICQAKNFLPNTYVFN